MARSIPWTLSRKVNLCTCVIRCPVRPTIIALFPPSYLCAYLCTAGPSQLWLRLLLFCILQVFSKRLRFSSRWQIGYFEKRRIDKRKIIQCLRETQTETQLILLDEVFSIWQCLAAKLVPVSHHTLFACDSVFSQLLRRAASVFAKFLPLPRTSITILCILRNRKTLFCSWHCVPFNHKAVIFKLLEMLCLRAESVRAN